MAAIPFDPLEYTHQLEELGVPRAQAEVHAKAMTAMFLHNFDALAIPVLQAVLVWVGLG